MHGVCTMIVNEQCQLDLIFFEKGRVVDCDERICVENSSSIDWVVRIDTCIRI